ncbi:MAG: hypothetical protein ACKV0T_17550 [Planctomycetales bacterium]
MSIAHQMAQGDLGQFFEEGRLADDFPRLIIANIDQITPELRKEVLTRDLEAKTGVFDTHPATRDRIENARRENSRGIYRRPAVPAGADLAHPGDAQRAAAAAQKPAPGLLEEGASSQGDLPASVLFQDFSGLSRAITREFYQEVLEREVVPEELHRVDDLRERQSVDLEAGRALDRYFQKQASVLRLLPFAADLLEPPASGKATSAALQQARQEMLAQLNVYREAFQRYDEADTRMLHALRAAALIGTGAKVNSELNLEQNSAIKAKSALRQARQSMEQLAGELEPFELAAATRFGAALKLTGVAKVRERLVAEGAPVATCQGFVDALLLLQSLQDPLGPLREQIPVAQTLCAALADNEQCQPLFQTIQSTADTIHDQLLSLRDRLGDAPYPFEHVKAGILLREFVFSEGEAGEVPEAEEIGQVFSTAEQAVERLLMLRIRLTARLAHLAERVEKLLGMEPLPDPPSEPAVPPDDE